MKDKSRLDKIVEDAGVGLASKATRRGFLGKVAGVSGAALFGGAVVLGEKHEADAVTPPAGCYGTTCGIVCWTGWRVTAAEAGYSGIVMRKGPSWSAPGVYNGGLVVIGVGQYFCRQSNRTCASGGCGDPGPRGNCNGFLYVYGNSNRKQGWVPYSGYAVGDTAGVNCCGPASVDYDCGKAKSACPSFNGCTGQSAGDMTASGAYWQIADAGSDEGNSNQKYYIRYARNGTSHGWICPADKILRNGYTSSGWSCISAHCCGWVPNGCKGWIDSTALGSTGSYNSCAGTGCCPG